MNREIFDEKWLESFLEFMDSKKPERRFDHKKRQLNYNGEDSKAFLKVRIPLNLEYSEIENTLIKVEFKNYVLVLIRSGIATVGYFENFTNADHKVFRAYMVRKKQGKSQIKYLKTKGKSRAGSRVRLAESITFFEEINQRLHSYFENFRVDAIGISYSETLMPYLFDSKISPPFSKKDPRIFKIPKHIQNPTYETLLATNEFLLSPEVKYDDAGKFIWQEFLDKSRTYNNEIDPCDDW